MRMRRLGAPLLAAALACVGLGAALGAGEADAAPAPTPQCRQLDPSLPWHDGVREFLQKAIDANSTCMGTVVPGQNKVAIFDWDNTVVKNDVGRGTNMYLLKNDLVLQPPNKDWSRTNRFITKAAVKALTKACGTKVPAGKPLPTSTNTACADEIIAITSGKTKAGEEAFKGFDHRWMEASFVWGGNLAAGYTDAQLATFAQKAKVGYEANPVGSTQVVGTSTTFDYIHVYPQIRDLVGTLVAHGITPWVVSASPEPIVKAWAPSAGFTVDHVVGIRYLHDRKGRQIHHLKGCGGQPDGADTITNYIDGKRCWTNQAVFGVKGKKALKRLPADQRQVLGAGDSVTDVTFVKDATHASLAINRNVPEFMCRAYDGLFSKGKGGTWAINPMFIEPLPQRPTPYQCSTAGTTRNGDPAPVRRADGSIIPDQVDSVF